MPSLTMRFYEELNDFLPPEKRKVPFEVSFRASPSIKRLIEAQGVPHTEVELVLVDSQPVGFERRVAGGERVSVYPVFESFDVTPVPRPRPEPLRSPRFVLDVRLGRLARLLRLLGFDAVHRNDYADGEIVRCARAQARIVLTRDRGLLMRREIDRGYCVRSTDPREQVIEVLRRFQLETAVRPDLKKSIATSRFFAKMGSRDPGRIQEREDCMSKGKDKGETKDKKKAQHSLKEKRKLKKEKKGKEEV